MGGVTEAVRGASGVIAAVSLRRRPWFAVAGMACRRRVG
jgi:hypothetical protein